MKKCILFIAVHLFVLTPVLLKAQTQIGITIISDESSGANRAFSIADFIAQKKYTGEVGMLEPKLVDYVYNTKFGLTGKLNSATGSFTLYKEGKSVTQITCENKWSLISAALESEFIKLGFNATGSKVKIDEGEKVKVYEKKMSDNLPGTMSFDLPKNKKAEDLKLSAGSIEYFEPKNILKDLKELHGKYGEADITSSKFFKSKDIPKELKEAVQPLASPIGKTMIMPALYISYGNALQEQNDPETAQQCYLQAIAGSNELIGSSKDKATIRGYAFEQLAVLQNGISASRVLLTKLYNTCAALNKKASLSAEMNAENISYYNNVKQVVELCQKAEQNAKSARTSRFGAIMGAVASGAGAGAIAFGGTAMASLSSTVQMMQVTMQKSQEQLMENKRFKEELRNVSMDIKGEEFITDGGGMENSSSFLAGEALYYLSQYAKEAKTVLEEYAADKPVLAKLVAYFYASANSSEKEKNLKELYRHLGKIEYTITNFETRNMAVPDKYTAGF